MQIVDELRAHGILVTHRGGDALIETAVDPADQYEAFKALSDQGKGRRRSRRASAAARRRERRICYLVNLYMYLNGYSCRNRVLRRSATKSSGFTVYPARCSASMIR